MGVYDQGEISNTYKSRTKKIAHSPKKSQVGKPGKSWKNYIKVDLMEVGCENGKLGSDSELC
jgi:hypothetical protein